VFPGATLENSVVARGLTVFDASWPHRDRSRLSPSSLKDPRAVAALAPI
jgi:hypothetical protein